MAMSNKEVEEMLYAVSYMQDLLHSTFSDASDAYEVLSSHEGDTKYILSLNYLSMSHQSYLEMRKVYHTNQLEHYEIDPFFRAYDDFKFQLKQIITDKDTNSSWLMSQYNALTECKNSVDEFLGNWIRSTQDSRSKL
jgi:hypothetical protein